MLGEPGSNQLNSPESYFEDGEAERLSDKEFNELRDNVVWNDDVPEDERMDVARRLVDDFGKRMTERLDEARKKITGN